MRFAGRVAVAVMFAFMGIAAAGAFAGVSAQQVYEAEALTERPRIASPMAAQRAIQAAYPRELQRAGTQGKVVLRFVVTPEGKVDPASIEVQDSDHTDLTDAARKALERIDFVPGRADGTAVATRVVFPISFVAG